MTYRRFINYSLLVNVNCLLTRRGLFSIRAIRCFCNVEIPKVQTHQENKLMRYFLNKIESTGPITVAEYMREVLINSQHGYYMNRDVFGASGDFITSPEISQMFGELIGVWFFSEWSRLRQPIPVQFVEFGPGRGTLADDILRVFNKLNTDEKPVSLHLIEVSPHLRELQRHKLCVASDVMSSRDPSGVIEESVTETGIPVRWHYSLDTVPENFTLFLAHEFFDALPIHKFQKTNDGWREVLIDCEKNTVDKLRFILSRGPTPAELFIDVNDERKELEVSPDSGLLIHKIATRLRKFGGIALIADYGYQNNEKGDTFRAFRNHELHDPLVDPGSADLTADVDFSYLCNHLLDEAIAIGPITQAHFLINMGIAVRLQDLIRKASPENRQLLQSGYEILLDSSQMGERYKFLALYPAVLKDVLSHFPPPGFSPE